MKKKDYILQKKSYVSPGMKVIELGLGALMQGNAASVFGPDQPFEPEDDDDEWEPAGQKGIFFVDFGNEGDYSY